MSRTRWTLAVQRYSFRLFREKTRDSHGRLLGDGATSLIRFERRAALAHDEASEQVGDLRTMRGLRPITQ